MSQPNIIRFITLGSSPNATRKTRHFHGDVELPPPHELRIVQYEGERGFYLFYCDQDGHEMTDTYHESIEDAMSQAMWEFNVRPDEWEKN